MDEDRYEPCPFVPSHHVRAGTRFQRHLEKCRKECLKNPHSPFYQTAKELQVCPFDVTHYIKPADMHAHVAICPSALNVAKMMQESRTPLQWSSPAPAAPDPWADKLDDEDVWDLDECAHVVPYDPQAKLKAGGHLVVPYGKSRSERVEHRRNMRIGGQPEDEAQPAPQAASAALAGGRAGSDTAPPPTVEAPTQPWGVGRGRGWTSGSNAARGGRGRAPGPTPFAEAIAPVGWGRGGPRSGGAS